MFVRPFLPPRTLSQFVSAAKEYIFSVPLFTQVPFRVPWRIRGNDMTVREGLKGGLCQRVNRASPQISIEGIFCHRHLAITLSEYLLNGDFHFYHPSPKQFYLRWGKYDAHRHNHHDHQDKSSESKVGRESESTLAIITIMCLQTKSGQTQMAGWWAFWWSNLYNRHSAGVCHTRKKPLKRALTKTPDNSPIIGAFL